MSNTKDLSKFKLKEKDVLPDSGGISFMGVSSGSADSLIMQELCKPEIETTEEFFVKDEVKLRRVTKKIKEKIQHMESGKTGRVVRIIDEDTVEVDFWNTVPARFPVKMGLLKLVNRQEPVIVDVKEDEPKKEIETIAKPKRYTQGKLEVWDAIIGMDLDFPQGNVVKYTARYKHKNGVEDLKKAMTYLLKIISEETGQDYYELRKKSLDEI